MYLLEHLAQLHSVDNNCVEVFRNYYYYCRYQEYIMLIETSPSLYIQLPANLTLYYNSTATTFATHKYCTFTLPQRENLCQKKVFFEGNFKFLFYVKTLFL